MNLKNLNKKQYTLFTLLGVISIGISILFLKKLGVKDAAMFFLATWLLIMEVYLIKRDIKTSILLFIISFPIMATARKVCNFDFLIFRVTYETIYITVLFLSNIKNIISLLKLYLKNKKSLEFKFIMGILIYIIFGYNSSVFSQNTYNSISEIFISILIPIMFMLSVISNFKSENVKKIVYALIISITLSSLYGFLQIFLYHIPIKAISSNREYLTFGYHNINIFACILMMIIPFLLQAILYEKNSKKESIFLILSLIISLMALFLTYTRGAWLAFLFAVFLILLSKKYRKYIYVLGIIFIAIAKPLISFILSRGTSTSIFTDESAIARIQSIFTSIRIITVYPFGTGAGTYAVMYKRYLEAGYMLIPVELRNNIQVANYALETAHNLWLQIGVELGLMCLIVFLLIFINRVRATFKNYHINRASFISLVMFLIFSVLTGFEFNHKGVITNNLILWLVFAMIQLNNSEYANRADI